MVAAGVEEAHFPEMSNDDLLTWNFVTQRIGLPEQVTFNDFVSTDDDIQICEELSDSAILAEVELNEGTAEIPGDDAEDESDDNEERSAHALHTCEEALAAVNAVKNYLSTRANVPDLVFQ